MKQINEIMKHSDAYKQLKKRKETSITEDVLSIKDLADGIYENTCTKYLKPQWMEIQKDDNHDIWEDHLDTIGIDPNSKCEAVILKVVAYVECDPPIYV